MDLELLLRRRPEWRAIAEGILFRAGSITANADAAEAESEEGAAQPDDPGGSLGIGSLRGS
jgi:hypothetical protein